MTDGLPAIHDIAEIPGLRGVARAFCLDVIAEVYGHAYRPDWHADLDRLAGGGEGDWYAAARRGRFLVALDGAGRIAATGGLHAVALKPALAERLAGHFSEIATVCQVARVYVRADARRGGLGASVHRALRAAALRAGYRTLYLHAAAHEAGALAFWTRQGYAQFGTIAYATAAGPETSVDFARAVGEPGSG